MGLATHIGANLGMKALHGTKLMGGIRSGGMARGIQRGVSGAPQGVGSRAAELFVGPELTATEHAGATLGKQLREMPVGRRYRRLKKLRKTVASDPSLHSAPIFEDMVPAINRTLERGLPKVGPERKASLLSRAAPYAMAAPIAAVDPALLVHAGVNLTRRAVAQSAPGMEFMRNGLVRGATGLAPREAAQRASTAVMRGASPVVGAAQPPSGLRMRIYDTLVSPAALDTERMGAAIRNSTNPRRLAGALAPTRQMQGELAKKGLGAVRRLAAPPPAPKPQFTPTASYTPPGVRY